MPIVSDKKKLTKEELESFKEIRQKTQSLIIELGEIELHKIQLESRHKIAQEYFSQLANEEEKLSNSIKEKYGDIQINPETGEISQIE